jgi:hypothetical protein
LRRKVYDSSKRVYLVYSIWCILPVCSVFQVDFAFQVVDVVDVAADIVDIAFQAVDIAS